MRKEGYRHVNPENEHPTQSDESRSLHVKTEKRSVRFKCKSKRKTRGKELDMNKKHYFSI